RATTSAGELSPAPVRTSRSASDAGSSIRCRHAPVAGPLASALQGGPQEPAVLLELLDDAGQEVDRVLVVLRLPQVAGLAQALQVGLDAVGQEPDVVQVAAGLRLVLRQARGLGRVADGAVDVGAPGDR